MTLPTVDMASIRRVLIIKMSALGDIIHALPVSAALAEAYPHLELTWAVEERFAPLVTGNPCLAGVLAFPRMSRRQLRSAGFRSGYLSRLRAIRAQRFDLALDLQGLTKSAMIAAASGAPLRLGYHFQREAARLLVQPVRARPESTHVVEQYLDVARFLGADPKAVRFPFHIPKEDHAAVAAMLCAAGVGAQTPFIAINPASALAIKQWGAENYGALLDAMHTQVGLPAVLVTADLEVAAQVRAAARHPYVDLAGRTSLKQLAAVLSRCAVHICGDTGSSHLAAALGRPVISLIGPTDPERACPYAQRAHVLSCRERCGPGCNSHHCSYRQPRCLAAIRAADVVQRIQMLVGSATERI